MTVTKKDATTTIVFPLVDSEHEKWADGGDVTLVLKPNYMQRYFCCMAKEYDTESGIWIESEIYQDNIVFRQSILEMHISCNPDADRWTLSVFTPGGSIAMFFGSKREAKSVRNNILKWKVT